MGDVEPVAPGGEQLWADALAAADKLLAWAAHRWPHVLGPGEDDVYVRIVMAAAVVDYASMVGDVADMPLQRLIDHLAVPARAADLGMRDRPLDVDVDVWMHVELASTDAARCRSSLPRRPEPSPWRQWRRRAYAVVAAHVTDGVALGQPAIVGVRTRAPALSRPRWVTSGKAERHRAWWVARDLVGGCCLSGEEAGVAVGAAAQVDAVDLWCSAPMAIGQCRWYLGHWAEVRQLVGVDVDEALLRGDAQRLIGMLRCAAAVLRAAAKPSEEVVAGDPAAARCLPSCGVARDKVEAYVERLAGGAWPSAVRQAARLVTRTGQGRYRPGEVPSQEVTVEALALLVYVVGTQAYRYTVCIGQLTSWVEPHVQASNDPADLHGITVDVRLLQAALASALEQAGHELAPVAHRGEIAPRRFDAVAKTWWDLVRMVPEPGTELGSGGPATRPGSQDRVLELGSDVWPGPNLGIGLHQAVVVIRAAAADHQGETSA